MSAPSPDQTWVVIPGHDVHPTLPRVLDELGADWRARTIVVDDGSQPPLEAPGVQLIRHPSNRGYGAAQKSGYALALAKGAQAILLLHGDGQYATAEVLALRVALEDAEAALGSRFLLDQGAGIPSWRRFGNRLLTSMANRRFHTRLSELHTGARAFRRSALQGIDLYALSDDYLFDQQLLLALLSRGAVIAERPATADYSDPVQSISLRRSVRYGLGCVRAILSAPTPSR